MSMIWRRCAAWAHDGGGERQGGRSGEPALRSVRRAAWPGTEGRSSGGSFRHLGFFVAALGLLIAGAGGTAWSEPLPDFSRPLSLADLERLALERNLSIAQARSSEAISRGARLGAFSALLPNLRGSVQFNQTSYNYATGRFDPSTGRALLEEGTDDEYGLSFNGGMSLIDLPAWYGFRSAGRSLDAATAGAEDTRAQILLQTRTQYYALARSEELARVALESVELRTEQLRRAESLFELGSVAKSDVLQAQVNLATAERERIASANRVEQVRALLAVLLAVPVESRIEIVPPPPVADIPAMPAESALIRRAQDARSDVLQARRALEAARLSAQGRRLEHLPSLALGYSYSKQQDKLADVFQDSKKDARWGYSLGLSMNIFDGLAAEGALQRATAETRLREEQLRAAELSAALAVREAMLAIKDASEALVASREGVRLAEESVRLQKALYESGGGTLLEWNNAQVELTRARVAVVEAEADLRVAEAQLERAAGGPVERS